MICIRLFDCHADTLSVAADSGCGIAANDGAVDLRRGRAYAPWAQAFATFIPDRLHGAAARCRCAALLDTVYRWERDDPTAFRIVRSRADLTDSGEVTCRALLTGENIGTLENIDCLDVLRARGMCAATLTWNGDNAWGSGCMGHEEGLTPLGHAALARMQTLGMTVDVSHLSENGFWDVVRQSRRPFIASHSNAAAVFPHPRNLTDAQFCAIRDGGGVVGLNFYHPHLGEKTAPFLSLLRRHLEHFLSLDGEDTVCIGTDFDGMDCPPEWNGMSFVQVVYDFLLSCGYAAALLDKVFYTNAMCFFTNALA